MKSYKLFLFLLVIFLFACQEKQINETENKPNINNNTRIIAENLIKSTIGDLSITKPVLGGTFFVTDIKWIDSNKMVVIYEDGHIQVNANITISVSNKGNVFIQNFEEITPSS